MRIGKILAVTQNLIDGEESKLVVCHMLYDISPTSYSSNSDIL